jgi:hypothetical protein
MTTMANIIKTYEFTPKDRGLLVMPLFHGQYYWSVALHLV